MTCLLVFDSHPVQYRVPIWQEIEKEKPGCLHVVYASDCSIRGHFDSGFGQKISWNEPMLSGYNYTILNCEHGLPLSGWSSLTGEGVSETLTRLNPSAILLTGLNYKYDWIVYWNAKKKGIPIYLRCETQDAAFQRSKIKSVLRSIVYNIAYVGFEGFFYIGNLNKKHYLEHGISSGKLYPTLYTTVDRFALLSTDQKIAIRQETRLLAHIPKDNFVVGFSGKLIHKKNPQLLYEMIAYLPEVIRSKITLYFIGSGELEPTLSGCAKQAKSQFGVQSVFVGFVNQADIAPHYLALDMLVLPSRQQGETWGLVVNEALQAGCSVAVSNHVGCGADFASMERFAIFNSEFPCKLADIITSFSRFERDFDWATPDLHYYSIERSAEEIIDRIM